MGSNPQSSTIFDSLSLHPDPKVVKNNNSFIPDNTTNIQVNNKIENSSGYNSSILSNSLQKSSFVTSNTQSGFHQDTNLVGEINFNFYLEHSDLAILDFLVMKKTHFLKVVNTLTN